MHVCFWGTRGSIAKAGPGTVRYGGNTSCVELRSAADTLVVLDCGTGAHGLGQALLAQNAGPVHGNILISHTHWDHIQGIPFFTPLFLPNHEWSIYAPRGLGTNLKETLAGQMQYTYFPVSLERLGATIRYHELVEGSFLVGDIRVVSQYLNHPGLALGYRLEADGVAVVYATDHEPHSPSAGLAGTRAGTASQETHSGDQRHIDFLAGADLVIHDAQYTAAEYSAKQGWGHSSVEYVVDTALAAGVKRLALFHHDPLRDDDAMDRIVASARLRVTDAGSLMEVFAAAEGARIELAPGNAIVAARNTSDALDLSGTVYSVTDQTVVVATGDTKLSALLAEAIRADGIRVVTAGDGETARALILQERAALAILDRHLQGSDGVAVCRALRAAGNVKDCPVVLIAAGEDASDVALGAEAGVTDWLIKPFSAEYARTKVRAWLLRTRARWTRAPIPENEPQRLLALRRLQVLDSPPEERFDRLTRLARHLLQVPIALISLVDSDRQWFKSRQGLTVSETPREVAFCAHAILTADTMVVPDALQDSRFADNPLVSGDPRVRFYAGQPLSAPDGSRVGTLCIIDHRPRQLTEPDLQALRDLGAIVEKELGTSHQG